MKKTQILKKQGEQYPRKERIKLNIVTRKPKQLGGQSE